jgi:outer membrane protein TolC
MIESIQFVNPIETRNGPIENQIMIGQKFPLWGKLKRQKSVAELAADNSLLALQDTKIKISYQIRKYWAEFVRLRNSIQVLKNYRDGLESFRGIALNQYSAGMGKTQHPILKLQIEQSLIEGRINALESSMEKAINKLKTIFNGFFNENMISDADIHVPSRPNNYWLMLARSSNPNYLISKNVHEMALKQKELSTRLNLPDLTAGLTYSIIDETELAGAPASGKDAFGIKLGLNLPIWLQKNKSRVQSSSLNIKAKEAELENTWNQIEEHIISAKTEYTNADETLLLYRDNLIQESEQMLSSALSAYKTGSISFLDLLDSERMALKVRLEFETALVNKRIASAKLLKTIGLIELMEQ